jgi:hypothetical protein
MLQVLLQSRRLQVAPTLPAAQTLVQELTTFQVKITPTANEAFGAWREGAHDDLVLAVAIAAWDGEHFGRCALRGEATRSGPRFWTPRPRAWWSGCTGCTCAPCGRCKTCGSWSP